MNGNNIINLGSFSYLNGLDFNPTDILIIDSMINLVMLLVLGSFGRTNSTAGSNKQLR